MLLLPLNLKVDVVQGKRDVVVQGKRDVVVQGKRVVVAVTIKP